MSWKDKQCRASAVVATGKVSKPNDMDMAARRILEGLGLTTSSFPRYERAEFDTNYTDECLWSRVQRLFYQHTAVNHPSGSSIWTSLVYCEPGDLPSKLKLSPMAEETPSSKQVWVYREGGECYCELLLPESSYGHLFLQPPYLAMKWLIPGIKIIKMKAKDFAKQYELRQYDESERPAD
jgi:hypothetical protein